MELSIPESVLLLLLDDESGKPLVDAMKLNYAVSGAALAELAALGAIRLTETDEPIAKRDHIVKTGQVIADPTLGELPEFVHRKRPPVALSMISGWMSGKDRSSKLKDAVLARLADAGLLSHEERKVLGIFPSKRWNRGERRDVEDVLQQRIRAVLTDEEPPDARTAAIVAILDASEALPKIVPSLDTKLVAERAKRIAEGDWSAEAISAALVTMDTAAQSAMTAVMITAVIAPSSN